MNLFVPLWLKCSTVLRRIQLLLPLQASSRKNRICLHSPPQSNTTSTRRRTTPWQQTFSCMTSSHPSSYQEEWTLSRMAHLYLHVVVWVVLQVLWPANPSASWWSSCGQWSLFVLHLLLLVSSSWLVCCLCWRCKCLIKYMGPLFYGEFCLFYNFTFIFHLITCIRTTSRSTDVQHITSLYQIAYVQRIRCIKK
jgi:hypothetical protein